MRDVRKTGEGRGLRRVAEKIVDMVSPGRLQGLRYQRRLETTASQDEREWRKTAEQGAGPLWRNGSLQRKPGLDFGMQYYA